MEFHHQRRVSFADTDAAGVVHFSRILCYVEEAEHALLESLEIPLLEHGGWPRVDVQCSYTAPILPTDTVGVMISPTQLGKTSIVWKFKVSNKGEICASGTMKTVRVNSEGKPTELEPAWCDKLTS